MALFESYERRIGQITPVLEKYGMKTLEDAKAVCDEYGIDPKLPCPKPTFLSSATEPGIQKACNPSPIASAASAAFVQPFFIAIAAPKTYAQAAFSNAIG